MEVIGKNEGNIREPAPEMLFGIYIGNLPTGVQEQLKIIFREIHPFVYSPRSKWPWTFGAIVEDIYDFVGIKKDPDGRTTVAFMWGDTPRSFFDQFGCPHTGRYLAEFGVGGELVREDFSWNGKPKSPPVDLETYLRNLRTGLLFRLHPTIRVVVQ